MSLEDALVIFTRLVEREELRILDVVGPAAGVGYQLRVLYGKLGFDSTGGDDNGQEAD